jgi:nascent polypeptide-associated complex subunit alpha
MIPGKVNPRQLKKMMNRMGISIKEIEDVEEIIIKTKEKEYRFTDAEVTIMGAQGQETYQISGSPVIKDRLNMEDVKLVAEKSGKTEREAAQALKDAKGDIAQAIMDLTE